MENGCARPWGELIVDIASSEVRHCDLSRAKQAWPGDLEGVQNFDLANTPEFTRIRREMLRNQRPSECSSCYELECQGRKSSRLPTSMIQDYYGRTGVFFNISHLRALSELSHLAAETGVIQTLRIRLPETPQSQWTDSQIQLFGSTLEWFSKHGHSLRSVTIEGRMNNSYPSKMQIVRAYGRAIESRVISYSCRLNFDPPLTRQNLGLRFEINRWTLSARDFTT